jgi:hypothetical protein
MTDLSKVIIRVNDIRAEGHCARGIKKWFVDNGFDFRDFLKNGIPADEFLATNDGYAKRIVDRKLRVRK